MPETSDSSASSGGGNGSSGGASGGAPLPLLPGISPPQPLKLKENASDNWKIWKQAWSNYKIVAQLNSRSDEFQMALFLHSIGPEAMKVYNAMSFGPGESNASLEDVIKKFDSFTTGEINETYERYLFNKRDQEPGENIDCYVTALRTMSKNCNFCNCLEESLIRDRIILGITDQHVRKRLLQERKLTLPKCIDLCRSAEVACAQMRTMGNTDDVNRISYKGGARQKSFTPKSKKSNDEHPKQGKPPARECLFCGTVHHLIKRKCPAWGKQCDNCGARNHFAIKCKKTSIHGVQEQQESDSDSDCEWIGCVHVNSVQPQQNKDYEVYAEMIVDGNPVVFQVDSGASTNVISKCYVEGHELKPSDKTLQMWNHTRERPAGVCRLKLLNPKTQKKYSVEFEVVEDRRTPLIGAKAGQAMKLITVNEENFKRVHQVDTVKLTEALTIDTLSEKYGDLFKGELGSLPGIVKLQTDPEVRPHVAKVRRVPIAVKPKLKAELDRLSEIGVLAPVDRPTPWVSQMVMATKKSGGVRICIDPKPLNKALKREHFQLPIIEDILPDLSKAKVFSKIDLRSGYWHLMLDDESSLLTTFQTPFGRYRWRRLPFGLSVSSEIFQKHLNQALDGLSNTLCIADDVLVYGVGDTWEEACQNHDLVFERLLQRCLEQGMKLNIDKLVLRATQVPFMGHLLTQDGIQPDPDKVDAILNMPKPEDVEAVRRVIGFVNYLAKFLPGLSDVMDPLRKLTHLDAEWTWNETHDKAMAEIKALVTAAPVLQYYDPTKELTLQCDSSGKGLGAALLQEGQPICYASRSLTDTETRYAQIEKEMLAIVYALEKFDQYTYGRKVRVTSDHKPLEAILKKPLASAPKRLQGMIMRVQRYNIEVVWLPGEKMYLADTLSRAYLSTEENPQAEFERINMAKFLPVSHEKLQDIQRHTESDESLQQLKDIILRGWPEVKSDVPNLAMPYFNVRDELSVQDCLIYRGDRLVIPGSMRDEMKRQLHKSHSGIDSTLRRARDSLYWPGMSAEIKQHVESCETCCKYGASQQKETLHGQQIPSRPWERVGVDLFSLDGREYMITVDYFSNFWEIDKLERPTARAVIQKLKAHFARYGSPNQVTSDNGPQFTSHEFQQFAQQWEFDHTTISPGNSKANGQAESAVKSAKKMLTKTKESKEDPYLAVLDLRNTPGEGMNDSPAQRLMNRRTRTLLPTTSNLLKPKGAESEQKRLQQKKDKVTNKYNMRAKDLRPLDEGDMVRIKPFTLGKSAWEKGTVTKVLDDRSYLVETDNGTYRRNRVHLRQTKESPEKPQHSTPLESGEARPQVTTHTPETQGKDDNCGESAPVPEASALKTSEPVRSDSAPKQTRSGRIVRPPARYVQE